MATQKLFGRIRAALDQAISLAELVAFIDTFAQTVCPDVAPDIEEELQTIHRDVGHDLSSRETEIFLAVLYHLRTLLPTASVITLWFDLVLRPALRQPDLPIPALDQASDLVPAFRRRLVDLYLWDAFNDGSGDDVIARAELDKVDREKKERWKVNLENVLLKHGIKQPEALMTELNAQFAAPTSRLQIFMLLNLFTSLPHFQESALSLASHPLMSQLLLSLLIDNSSTMCSVGMTLLVKILPLFAVHASDNLKLILPELLVILARVVCWKERGLPPNDSEAALGLLDSSNTSPPLDPNPDLNWERLEATFYAAAATPPSPDRYFTFLYYLFPCNVLRFLRTPLMFLGECDFPSLFTKEWCEIIDEKELKGKAENLLRAHQCHPLIIWRDADEERSGRNFWAKYDIERITSEATILDSTNMALAIRARAAESRSHDAISVADSALTEEEVMSLQVDPSSSVPRISLQDMVATSVALKSNLNVQIINPTSQWPTSMFAHPSKEDMSRPASVLSSGSSDDVPAHITQAIASLQREVVLLRNELNFEIWLSRENVQHVGRLYQERIVSNNVEVERQGLYNKLRNYRSQVIELENELKENKQQASSARSKYAEWNTELQSKLHKLREEKKQWTTEAAALRSEVKQAKALYDGQEALLVDANERIFELETKRKETQPKVDRLKDYERQIEQHIKVQQLWESDFTKFNEQKEEVAEVKSHIQQMRIQMKDQLEYQKDLEEQNRQSAREIQTLQARLEEATRKTKAADPSQMLSVLTQQQSTLQRTNEELHEKNIEQSQMIEELQAMVEVLRTRHNYI
ncbi:hypothetical protein BDZ89DRAFT_1056142 [Hymenopellis radicata]|nr:hypothetical protein BDZ89DRAFT_1056142 [Hymenopellis radicata]